MARAILPANFRAGAASPRVHARAARDVQRADARHLLPPADGGHRRRQNYARVAFATRYEHKKEKSILDLKKARRLLFRQMHFAKKKRFCKELRSTSARPSRLAFVAIPSRARATRRDAPRASRGEQAHASSRSSTTRQRRVVHGPLALCAFAAPLGTFLRWGFWRGFRVFRFASRGFPFISKKTPQKRALVFLGG